MRLVEVPVSEFDLRRTLESGQVFHWTEEGQGWRGLIDRTPVYVEQVAKKIRISFPHAKRVAKYFAFDHPMEKIYQTFPKHPFMQEALRSCRGIRVIRQPYWECLGTFITSPMKQVSHIRQMSFALRERYGLKIENSALRAYPEPESLASGTEKDLRECGLGFRAKSLLLAARMIAEGKLDLKEVARMPTKEARETLCGVPGVGKKVANCVLLFAYERLDAVPIDVWIGRVLKEVFLKGKRRITARQMEEFSQTGLGSYAGYAQQYLFHHARTVKRERNK